METKNKVIGIAIIGIFVITILSTNAFTKFGAAQGVVDSTPTHVLLLTNWSPKDQSPLAVSLGLDSRIHTTVFGSADDAPNAIQSYNMSNFDVVVVDCYLPKLPADQKWLHDQILSHNLGLLFFGANYTWGIDQFEDLIPAYFYLNTNQLNQTVAGVMTGNVTQSNLMNDYLGIVYNNTQPSSISLDQIQVAVSAQESALPSSQQSIFATSVAWQSCPLLRERVFTYAAYSHAQTIVSVPNTGEPLVVLAKFSDFLNYTTADSQVLYISTGVGEITVSGSTYEMNEPFKLWPYFNYLMYEAVFYLNVNYNPAHIQSYADWPYSPIPHAQQAAWWMTFVAALWIFNFLLFFGLGRKKKSKDQATQDAADAAAADANKETAPSTDQPKEPKNEEPKTEDTFSEVGMKDTPEEPTDLDHPASELDL